MKLIWGIVAMAITASTALAQAGGVNHYSAAQVEADGAEAGAAGKFSQHGVGF